MVQPVIQQNDISSVTLFDNVFDDVTLSATGAVTYDEGTVLGFDKATGKYVATNTTVANAENAKAVLMGTAEYSGVGDKKVRAVIGGQVDEDLLIFVDGGDGIDTIPAGADDSFRTQLRSYGIVALKREEGTFYNNS
jgi:hypothetical protein